jgi:hypothetical protein
LRIARHGRRGCVYYFATAQEVDCGRRHLHIRAVETDALFDVFELDTASCAQAVPCLLNATHEARVVLETVLKPVLFRLETNQHAGWLAMA